MTGKTKSIFAAIGFNHLGLYKTPTLRSLRSSYFSSRLTCVFVTAKFCEEPQRTQRFYQPRRFSFPTLQSFASLLKPHRFLLRSIPIKPMRFFSSASYSSSITISFWSTIVFALNTTRFTLPAEGEDTVLSIFIASITNNGVPD